ncbi:MAG: exo-alpha-sialidase [Tepidisphaeraceae bacterium]
MKPRRSSSAFYCSARQILGLTILVAGGCAPNHGNEVAQPPAAPPPYVWKSVQMVGGGFVDGIVFHPTEKGLRYARTDIGGAYRWDDQQKQWMPILDWLPYKDTHLMGCESIAVDPADPNRVYLACGMYTNATTPNAAILRSDDRGSTFERTNMPFKMGGNEDGRGNGERLAVDPNDGKVIYFGSRHDGLWRSTDRAVTWSKVDTFPDVNEAAATQPSPRRRRFGFAARSSGVVFEIFDPRSGTAGTPSSTLYVGVSLIGRDNFYRSTDAGATWRAVPGEPTNLRPSHGVLASNGTIYLSYGSAPGPSRMTSGAIWKFDTNSAEWTNITPEKPKPSTRPTSGPGGGGGFGYGAVSVDAHDPDALIASTFYHPDGEELFRSTDAGKTWRPIFHRGGGTYDYSGAPYVAHTPIHWLLDIQIDPCDPNHAMFTTGYGGWETFDLTDADAGKPTHWSVMSKGIEEVVAMQIVSPPSGVHLISAIGDYGGFVHWDLDKPNADGNFDHPNFGNTSGVAFAQNNPDIIVRVGNVAGSQRGRDTNIAYSLDGGKTWHSTPSMPSSRSAGGSISVSADGTRWIWTPERASPFLTRDRGVKWTQIPGLPPNTHVLADPINPRKFYAMALFDGNLFVSGDGGETFESKPLTLPGGLPRPAQLDSNGNNRGDRGDGRGGQDRLYATPGVEGDLWIAAFDGLYHSTDTGQTFAKLDGVEQIHGFGFGKAAPGAGTPALYLMGIVRGKDAIYRSDDFAKTWLRINDDRHQYGLLLQITGDPRIYGRVYVGTHGRGVLYGDPADSVTHPKS